MLDLGDPADRIQPQRPERAATRACAGGLGRGTGGILGAAVSSPRNAGAGLLLGALLGGAVGAGAEATADANAQAAADANSNAHMQAQAAQIERKASDYRRAIGACLEGRGYSIK
jgi:hypothetical protein